MSTVPHAVASHPDEPGLAEAPPAPTPAMPAPKRHRLRWLLAAVAMALIALGTRVWLESRTRVSTDDAQVDGHIVPVIARVGGYVETVNVIENQPVKVGDLLVQIDDRDLRTRLEQAEAQYLTAQAMAGSKVTPGEATAQLAVAHANVAQAEADARNTATDLARYRALAAQKIISAQQLDQAETAAETAAARLAAAQQQVSVASAGERAAGGELAGARAARDEAALQVSYTHITAPMEGVVSHKGVEVGQLVQPGQQLMSVVPLSDIWVVANLKETQLKGVDPGDHVDIRVDSDPSVRHQGRVESISPATGAKFSLLPPDNATGNFTKVVQRVPVRIRFTGPNDGPHPLRPGMSVSVTIHTR